MLMRDWRPGTLSVSAIFFGGGVWRDGMIPGSMESGLRLKGCETHAPLDKRCDGLAGGVAKRRPDCAGQAGARDLSGIAPAGKTPHAAGAGVGESRPDARNRGTRQ